MDIIRNSIIGLSTILILLVLIWVFDEEEKPHIDSVIGDKEYDIKNYIRNDLIIKTEREAYISIKEDYNKKLTKQKWDNQIKLGKIEYDRKQARLAELEKLRLAREKEKKEISISRSNSGVVAYEAYFNVSFYSADYASTGKHKEDKYYGVTASGNKVKLNHTIACPPSMPFGTKVHIEDVGYRVCEDRGGSIKGQRLDVYVDSEKEAYRLGRQQLKVKVFK